MAKPSRLSRLARLGGLTGRVTSSYLGNAVKDAFRDSDMRERAKQRLHLDNAREIVQTVGRMKGAAMKLGQQMAIAADALDLPPEVAATLGQLNTKGEPIPFEQIREDIVSELGKPLDQLFSRFDEIPIGTASLGQAHSAALPDGTEVVVKVLHRGVEDSVDTDLLALRTLLLSGRALRRPKAELNAIFDEISERLKEELDYLQEAANIHAYQQFFSNDPDITVPSLHQPWCTERILTMDRIQGTHIEQFAQTGSEEARQRAAQTLAELYYRQAFRFRTLHADPHPGNFLFADDGTVGLIDYGCIKRFNEFWIADYAGCALAIHQQDRQRALQHAVAIGAWDGEGEEAAQTLWNYLDAIGTGFRMGPVQLGATGEKLNEAVTRTGRELVNHRNITLPREIIFLHRSLGGLYTLSRQLKRPVDYGEVATRYAREAVDNVAI